MLRPRLIPVLLVHKGGLYKTVSFTSPKYVGDPLNAVRIFNEKEVDELAVFDIDASRLGKEPDYALVRRLASECRMPLAYGGGVKTVHQVQKLVALGVEKVAVSSAIFDTPELLSEAASRVGCQSIVAVLDVRRLGDSWEVFTHNGTRATGSGIVEMVKRVDSLGAGEIVLNSIDRDGHMNGYDLDLVRAVRGWTNRPLTVLGGAGKLSDISSLAQEFGAIGAAAGSIFVFKGVLRAVLISYPSRETKDALTRLGPA
jgi:cyclase